MTAPTKILIVRLSSLGDILHTLPAFRSLRVTFPKAAIDWLVEERAKSVLSAVAGIDNVLVIDTKALRRTPWNRAVWKRNWQIIRTMRSKHYDVALDFQGLLKTALLSFLSGARIRIGFAKELARESRAALFYSRTLSKPANQQHIVAQNQSLAELAGASAASSPVELLAPPADVEQIQRLLARVSVEEFVVINPGGGWYTKRWHPVKYGALAKRIRCELGLHVIVTTGPGEEPLYREIAANSGDSPPLHFVLPFLLLIPLFRQARVVIGGDTGPFHLACALGTPAVGIFGPTSPVRNGPWRNRDEAVAHVLSCSYCNGRTCPTQNECMEIPVEEVFEAVVRRLRKEVEHSK